jgi:hypothetical protein
LGVDEEFRVALYKRSAEYAELKKQHAAEYDEFKEQNADIF